MKTIGEQAKEYRLWRGWKTSDMAKAVGTSRQNIENLESGARQPRYLADLARAMDVPVDVLLRGEYVAPAEQPPATSGVEEEQVEYAGKPHASRRVPVVGTAKMGDNGYFEEFSEMPGAGDGHIEIATEDPEAYCLRVRGQSMFPAIRDGWYVLIEPNMPVVTGEYVLLKLRSGKKMVKELLIRRNRSVEVMSVNDGERLTFGFEDLDDHRGLQAVGAVVTPSKWRPD